MMEEASVLQRTITIKDKRNRTDFPGGLSYSEKPYANPVIDKLISEGGENFFNYLDWNGLANEPNLLLLSSNKHYYYDHEEMKGVTTLINLKKLNLIKHLDDFFRNVNNILSPKTNFIGCFTDRKNQDKGGLIARFYRRFINFLDARTEKEIDKKSLSRLLESYGFNIVDMTEINGLTYFRTQNRGML